MTGRDRGVLRCWGVGVLGCALSPACSPVAAKAARKPAPAAPAKTLSTRLIGLKTGHVAVQVRVNNKGPFRLILDTGSPLTFLSSRAATKAGLLAPGKASQTALFGMRGQTRVKTLDVGAARVKELDVLILDHPVVEMLGQVDGPLDGIVGFSFFSRFRTTLDYEAGRVSFTPVSYQPEDVMTSLVQRLSSTDRRPRVLAPAGLWGMKVGPSETDPGVLVTEVYPRSAAEAAGLQVGDRITMIDGRWTESVLECYDAAARVPAGQTAVVKVVRLGEDKELKVRPRLGL